MTVECNQKTTSQMDSMSSDIAVGSAELVEAVFDRLTMGLYRSKDEVPTPEYCEVSVERLRFDDVYGKRERGGHTFTYA